MTISGLMKTSSWSFCSGSAVRLTQEEAIGQAHLVGGQADSPGGVHQLEHLRDGRPQVVVDLGHGPREITKSRVGIIDDIAARVTLRTGGSFDTNIL